MNILVVDDDNYIAEGIVKTVCWVELGIQRVFTAFSMKQAQKVLDEEQIDILLTDIEMPKGSGFDLLEWAYSKGLNPVTLFLTSHAKFEYAQKAIQMQCMGYIVKPADAVKLEKELRQAVETKRKKDQEKNYQHLAECWNDKLIKRTEGFWYELFNGKIPPKEKNIQAVIHKEQLSPELMSKDYYYILIQVELNDSAVSWGKDLINYAIRNILSETLYNEISGPLPEMDEDHFMMMCSTDGYMSEDEISASCDEAARACKNALPGKFTLFISRPGKITDAFKQYKTLKKLENDYFTTDSLVLSESSLENFTPQSVTYQAIESWTEALLTYKKQAVIDQLKSFFSNSQQFYPRSLLNDLYYGILQAVYISFEKKSLPSKELFVNEEYQPYIAEATISIGGFFRWADFILERAAKELHSNMGFGYIVENVRQYVQEHIDDEFLDRSRIAAAIHLNPDYLSFSFKEKYGQSLCSFIASERVKAAKKMLISTDLPITEVSIRTGYTDISYFSKQFKQVAGMSPQQYRKSTLPHNLSI